LSRNVRVGAAVVTALALTASVAVGLLAAYARAATSGTTAVSTVSAALKAKTGAGKGALTGKLSSASAASGTLTWKLTYSGLSGPATGVQLRQGAKVLVRLCTTACASGVHKSVVLKGATLTAVSAGKATVTVSTKAKAAGEISGALKVKGASTGGGGGTTVAVTPAAVAAGKKFATDTFGCTGCHTISGAKSTGPTWKGLAGSKVHLTDGTTITATDSYLIGVITDPSTLKVEGYDSGVMSEVIAPGQVSDTQARDIVAYIKSLK
jgi:cytochrome c1